MHRDIHSDIHLIYVSDEGKTANIRHACLDEGFFEAGLHFSMLNPAESEINKIKAVINECFCCDYIVIDCKDKKKAGHIAEEISHLYPEQDIILISNIANIMTPFPNLKVFPNLSEFARYIITQHTEPRE